jgi:hypothetical protein
MTLTRRGLLKGSVVAAAATGAHVEFAGAASHKPAADDPSAVDMLRETLLLDFGWRFHLGHACDPAQDFGFGGDLRTFAKAGDDVAAAADLEFDDGAWTAIDLPHDWAVELPFVPSPPPPTGNEDDPNAEHGFRPLGRDYPETSIGWYRRAFALDAGDLGKRISLEFDGVFRNCLVMFNGYAVGGNEERLCAISHRRDGFRELRRQERADGSRGRDARRRLVLRRGRHLSPCLAGEDRAGAYRPMESHGSARRQRHKRRGIALCAEVTNDRRSSRAMHHCLDDPRSFGPKCRHNKIRTGANSHRARPSTSAER